MKKLYAKPYHHFGDYAQKSKNAYVAQWVYSRLTDSSGNTYPRSLTILLKKAQEVELRKIKEKMHLVIIYYVGIL